MNKDINVLYIVSLGYANVYVLIMLIDIFELDVFKFLFLL